jgi:hypothetical protein
MECNTPVIGKIPNLIPEWLEGKDSDGNSIIKNNGVWTNTTINIPELIATYLKIWLEDSVPSDLYEGMNDTKGRYTSEKQVESIKTVFDSLTENRVNEFKITKESLETSYSELTNIHQKN